MTGITPVTLNEKRMVPVIGDPLDVAGWGNTVIPNTGDPIYSTVLKNTAVNYITNEKCTSEYKYQPNNITENMLCAFEEDTDTCQGDSGE